jgi:hypothetical protein
MPDLTYLTRTDPHRFDLSDGRTSMKAVPATEVTTGWITATYRDPRSGRASCC